MLFRSVIDSVRVGIWSTDITLRGYFESTTENSAAHVKMKLKIKRTMLFSWQISEITVLYYSDIDWF